MTIYWDIAHIRRTSSCIDTPRRYLRSQLIPNCKHKKRWPPVPISKYVLIFSGNPVSCELMLFPKTHMFRVHTCSSRFLTEWDLRPPYTYDTNFRSKAFRQAPVKSIDNRSYARPLTYIATDATPNPPWDSPRESGLKIAVPSSPW